MGNIKPWEELTIQDEYMFKLIMSRKRICKKMLEKILKIKIKDIRYIEEEKTVKPKYESKGVRLKELEEERARYMTFVTEGFTFKEMNLWKTYTID